MRDLPREDTQIASLLRAIDAPIYSVFAGCSASRMCDGRVYAFRYDHAAHDDLYQFAPADARELAFELYLTHMTHPEVAPEDGFMHTSERVRIKVDGTHDVQN